MEFKPTFRIPIVAAGGTVTIPLSEPFTQVHLYTSGAVTALANNTITYSGTPIEGQSIEFLCELSNLDLDIFDLTLFGEAINGTIVENTIFRAVATYSTNVAKFVVTTFPDFEGTAFIEAGHIASDAVTTAKILDDAVTLDKLVNITQGSILVGGAANAPTELIAKTSGQVLIGDGTDLASVAVSGDVTISSAGVTTIGAAKVTPSMLSFNLSSYLEVELTIATADVLTLNASPITIVAAPGAGKYIEVISASASMTFAAAAYATNTTLQLITDGASIAQLQDTALLISTVNKIVKFQDVTAATAAQTQLISNAALQVKVATGDPTLGDSDIKIFVQYRIVTA